MSFEKVRFGKGEIFKIEIEDGAGKVIDKWVVMKNDLWKVLRILNEKFSLGLRINKERRDKDLEWAM